MIEHRKSLTQQADAVDIAEGNMYVNRYGEITYTAAVSENYSCYTMMMHQLERTITLRIYCVRVRYGKQAKSKDAKWRTGSRRPE